MITLLIISSLGAVLGFACVRWLGWIGFLLAGLVTFAAHFVIHFLGGYEGLPWSESLTFFNGSVLSFAGYSAQITYRAFAIPALAVGLGAVLGMKGQRSV